MPPTEKFPQGHKLALRDRVLVVIGANGSGKTRFGVWLQAQDDSRHRRVSAHRALVFPERVQPIDFKDAERRLFTGHTNINNTVPPGIHQRRQKQSSNCAPKRF